MLHFLIFSSFVWRLFLNPVADVMPSGKIGITGGAATYAPQEYFVVSAINAGVGGISEIEIGLLNLFASMGKGILIFPVSGVKFGFMRKNYAFSLLFKSTVIAQPGGMVYFTGEEPGAWAGADYYNYSIKYGALYVMQRLTLNKFSFYLNFNFSESKIISKYEHPIEPLEKEKGIISRTWGYAFGVTYPVKEITYLMFELSRLPKLIYERNKFENFDVALFGVRHYFTPHFATDFAVAYPLAESGLAGIVIHGNLLFYSEFSGLARSLKKSKSE